ncbi:MAG TPA: LysR family transcriptional regulator [Candidatus Kapabacteria bacterium]|nr:LysR family transcriptional regulator [Candidatus Kapabacteria bacterium]
MTIQQAEICSRLALLGSVNAVAKSLGITQPAVSSALSVLEKELGVALFIRSKSGVMPTRKGEELLPYFRTIVAASSGILSKSAMLPADRGTITIAGRQGFMQYVFPPLYEAITKKYPLITIEQLISGNQKDIIEALISGRADICFAPSPKIKSIQAETIFHDPVYICISRSHPAIEKGKITKKTLGELEYCLPARGDRLRKPIEQLIRKHIKHPAISLEVNDFTLIAKLVAKRKFVGPLYHHLLLADDIYKDIIPISLFSPMIYRDLTVLTRRDGVLPHVLTAKDFFRDEVSRFLPQRVNMI